MSKIIKVLNTIFIIMIFIFVSSCGDTDDSVPDELINGQKSDLLYLDFVMFTVHNIDMIYTDIEGNEVNVIEVNIEKNFNDIIGSETSYSKYIQKVIEENKSIKLVVSDTYCKYIKRGDRFIYKLDDTNKIIIDDKIEEVYSTLNNEYTLLPVIENNFYVTYTTSNIPYIKFNDYELETIALQRDVFYGYDFDSHFIEYDYSLGYYDFVTYILTTETTIERFEKSLKALQNETLESFYKLKYSELLKRANNDPTLLSEIENYLNEIGGQ